LAVPTTWFAVISLLAVDQLGHAEIEELDEIRADPCGRPA
jgi:hypothetical protein